MPLKKISVFISFLFLLTMTTVGLAQTEPKSTTLAELKNSSPPATPTSAEIMRDRISKAKAFLVVKNYGAAIYDLENIRRETNDVTVHRVLNVLLMHAYLEQGDYIKAQKFLKELHTSKSVSAPIDYLAVAGQVVNGAKTQLERYKSLGLSVSDRNLPVEASSDVENMRKTLELIVEQSKALSQNKEVSANAFALLEETSSARSELAKDDYDARRWKDSVADAREQIVNPNGRIINAVGNPPITSPSPDIVAVNEIKPRSITPKPAPVEKAESKPETKKEDIPGFQPVAENKTSQPKTEKPVEKPVEKPTEKIVAKNNTPRPNDRKVRIIGSAEKDKPATPKPINVKSTDTEKPKAEEKKPVENNVAKNTPKVNDDSPLPVGSLIGYATKRVNPVYPRQARNMRMTGTVTVEILVDKDGKVTEVGDTQGPTLLKRAAADAVRKWRFRPFERDGEPVEAKGFVSFNFNL
jgi:protein TonB